MSDDILPALNVAEWSGVLANRPKLAAMLEELLDTPFSGHAVAALLLFEQPYGFDQNDVDDETQVAAYCAKMADDHTAAGNASVAATFRELGERHLVRARKIAALLPPQA